MAAATAAATVTVTKARRLLQQQPVAEAAVVRAASAATAQVGTALRAVNLGRKGLLYWEEGRPRVDSFIDRALLILHDP